MGKDNSYQNFNGVPTKTLTLEILCRDGTGRGLNVVPRLEGLLLLVHFIVMRLFIHVDCFVCLRGSLKGRPDGKVRLP